MAEKKQISAREIVADIMVGLTDEQLMKKHMLSAKGLEGVKNKLLAAGLITQSQLDRKSTPTKVTPKVDKRALAKNIADGVKSGLSDNEVSKRFGISPTKLTPLYNSLIKAGYLNLHDLTNRRKQSEEQGDLEPEAAKLPEPSGAAPVEDDHRESVLDKPKEKDAETRKVRKCPNCKMPQEEEFEICPQCGVIVGKYLEKIESEKPKQKKRSKIARVVGWIAACIGGFLVLLFIIGLLAAPQEEKTTAKVDDSTKAASSRPSSNKISYAELKSGYIEKTCTCNKTTPEERAKGAGCDFQCKNFKMGVMLTFFGTEEDIKESVFTFADQTLSPTRDTVIRDLQQKMYGKGRSEEVIKWTDKALQDILSDKSQEGERKFYNKIVSIKKFPLNQLKMIVLSIRNSDFERDRGTAVKPPAQPEQGTVVRPQAQSNLPVVETAPHNDGGAAYRCMEECNKQVRVQVPITAPEYRQVVDECIANNPNCPEPVRQMAAHNIKERTKTPQPNRPWTEVDKQMLKQQKCAAECGQKLGDVKMPKAPTREEMLLYTQEILLHNRALDECVRDCEERQR